MDFPHRSASLEISRLVLAPDLTGAAGLEVTELLFKLLYQFCRAHHYEHLYAVLEAGWIRRFRHCFQLPFHPLGPSVKFPDGTRTVAAHAAISDLERTLRERNPDKLDWYQEALVSCVLIKQN
jgi:N-acyl-L-homoserine lactone synthetase